MNARTPRPASTGPGLRPDSGPTELESNVPDTTEHTLVAEHWLPVPGYESSYEVSDAGRVRSLTRVVTLSDGRRMTIRERIMKTDVGEHGHLSVHLSRTGTKAKAFYVHRLVLTAFVGTAPDGMEGCHGNGDAEDNRLANLRWDTPSANNFDRSRHGTNHCANRPTCPYGHDLVEPNLVATVSKRGHRSCRACQAAYNVTYRRRVKGLPELDFQVLSDERYRKIMHL